VLAAAEARDGRAALAGRREDRRRDALGPTQGLEVLVVVGSNRPHRGAGRRRVDETEPQRDGADAEVLERIHPERPIIGYSRRAAKRQRRLPKTPPRRVSERGWARPVIVALAALLLPACSSARPPEAPHPQPVEIHAPHEYRPGDAGGGEAEGLGDICKIDPTACPTVDMDKAAARTMNLQMFATSGRRGTMASLQHQVIGAAAGLTGRLAGGSAPPPPAPTPVESSTAAANEMVDVIARLEVQVEGVAQAAAKARALVGAAGGQLVNEVVEHQQSGEGAALSIRVPAARAEALLGDLARLGNVRSRKIEAQDVGREYHDAEILLKNLEAALLRYEELLKKAQTVADMVTIEAALARVRAQLDRVQGDMRYLADRAARSTIYLTLVEASPQGTDALPEAKLHPGGRATVLFDIDGQGATRTFVGGGLSLFIARWFSFDMDLATRTQMAHGIDAIALTAGGELYSDFLGGGKRLALNPYLGFRGGYFRLVGENAAAVGGTVGVELYKTRVVLLDLGVRSYALIGFGGAVHAAIQPAIGVNVSY
jgi:Domain of unknown function (DUF4349)